MNLDAKELKKLMYDFNRVSERLMHTDFADFSSNTSKFINFIENNEVINRFVSSAGDPTFDINTEIAEVSHGNAIFDIGDDENGEIANIYCILRYIVENNISYRSMIFYGYGHGSTKYQDMIDEFNSRVTMVLISHIEAYLTRLGYDMGLDQRNINNNFYGTVNNLGLQQGNNNTMINNNDASIDYEMIKTIIDELQRNKSSFDTAFGDNSGKFVDDLNKLAVAVDEQEPSKVKALLTSLKTIAEGAAGNLIASGVIALLARIPLA